MASKVLPQVIPLVPVETQRDRALLLNDLIDAADASARLLRATAERMTGEGKWQCLAAGLGEALGAVAYDANRRLRHR